MAGFSLVRETLLRLTLGGAGGAGQTSGQRQITTGREQKIATGVKLAALRLLPLTADLRHALTRLFQAVSGAVAHSPGDNAQAAAVTAFCGTNLKVVACAQAEIIGGIQLRALQPDIGAAEADIPSTHRRLTQGILQIGTDRQRLRLHINAARLDIATQVLKLVEIMREAGRIDSLQLLHFHLGSQMSNIRDIATGVRESARFYVELARLGVNIKCFDVGGGLGVDYEGTRSQSDCSVNYGLNEYANNVIWAIGAACDEHGLEHPTVITESGRAVTAHHTVLVSNIIGVERNDSSDPKPREGEAPRPTLSRGEPGRERHEQSPRRSLREWLHDSQMDLFDIHTGYSSGTYDLKQRSWAEQLYLSICHYIQQHLDPSNRAHRPIIDELQERMADKIYVNFSLFQSMPDAWGIDQLFPVLPLEGLNKKPERRAVLLDITCDSDGTIDHYVDGDGIATTMPMPEYDLDNPPMLGFFMVGAYQEILGNMHNLFGDTEAVDVYARENGDVEVQLSDEGDTVADMLRYVQLDPNELMALFRNQVQASDLDEELRAQFLEEFESGLYGYTYLEDE